MTRAINGRFTVIGLLISLSIGFSQPLYAENYKTNYCGNNVYVPAGNKYPHLHCDKDFFVYSESKTNHKDLARGSDVYCERTRSVIDTIKALGPTKIADYQTVLNDTLSFARVHCKSR